MANISYRQATMADADAIWQIISDAKAVMSIDHNPQWDNGYPSPEIIKADIAKGYAYILQRDDEIVATATLWQEKDVNYQRLQGGRWLYPTKRKPYAVIHPSHGGVIPTPRLPFVDRAFYAFICDSPCKWV